MLSINKIPFFINKFRKRDLLSFRKEVIEYFNTIKYDGDSILENNRSIILRSEINKKISKVNEIIYASGINSTLVVSPP